MRERTDGRGFATRAIHAGERPDPTTRAHNTPIYATATFANFGTLHAMAEQIENLFADILELHAQIHQNLSCHTLLFAKQTQENMFGADVVMIEIASFFHRILDDFFGSRRLRQLADSDHFGAALNQFFDFEPNLSKVDV